MRFFWKECRKKALVAFHVEFTYVEKTYRHTKNEHEMETKNNGLWIHVFLTNNTNQWPMAPSGKLRLTKANKKRTKNKFCCFVRWNYWLQCTDRYKHSFSQSPNRSHENQTQQSKMTIETTETVSTLSNGTGLVTFDSFATKWNLREAIKGCLLYTSDAADE